MSVILTEHFGSKWQAVMPRKLLPDVFKIKVIECESMPTKFTDHIKNEGKMCSQKYAGLNVLLVEDS